MARIRTVKPEFWTSEQIADCSREARLLFIGIWSFCDDSGIHPANCRRLKMEIFPGDEDVNSTDIRRMVDELIANRLMSEYSVGGVSYWIVSGWKHQKIDQPTFRFPKPDGGVPSTPPRRTKEDSANANRLLAEHSGREGSLKESKGRDAAEKQAAPSGEPDHTIDPTGFCEAVIDHYQTHWQTRPPCDFPTIQKVLTHIERHPVAAHLGWWNWYFEFARMDEFLSGQKRPGFVASLSYLLKPETLALVIEAGQRAALEVAHV